ncbi:MAG: carbon-nitrogen hydrolase family protein [Sedimentisphaerales bacterium]
MFSILCTGDGASVWGGLFVVIVVIGTIIRILSRRKGPSIAMCQIFILDGDRSGNFVRIENAIAEAKSKGAELLCFPEATMLGWLNSDAHSRACTIPGPDSEQLCELAKKYGVYLCIGVEEFEMGRLFNSALLIDDRGQILHKHRQVNIPQKLMSPPYSAGNESNIATVNTKFGKIALLICADTHREDLLDRVAALKPNLLLAPYGYAEEELKWPAHGNEFHNVVINAAKRTGAAVLGTNPVGRISRGPWSGRIYGGQSIAVDKTGNIIDTAKDRDRDVKIVPIAAVR